MQPLHPPQHFKAYRTFQEDGVIRSRFVEMAPDDLDPGDVLVRTKYSTINYKDALSYNGAGKIMRKYPTVAGIDMAGTVETSADPRFRHGDKVIVHAYDMGVAHDGGYAEYARVPADWVVRRSPNMTAFEAMTLGTAGFTAALAVELMQHNGLTPASGPVIVNGATDPADDPSVRQCADNMIKFFEQHEMPCVQPVHLGGTLAYPEQRFPDPLPAGTTGVLEQLADEIRRGSGAGDTGTSVAL